MATTKKKAGSARTKAGPGPRRKRALEKRKAEERANKPTPKERELTGVQVRYLRGLGHHLQAVVQLGKEGITPGLVRALKEALLAHELVKVRVLQEAPVDRKDAGAELAKLAACSVVQTLGRTVLLYKRHPNKPKITLPKAGQAVRAKATPVPVREGDDEDDDDSPQRDDDE